MKISEQYLLIDTNVAYCVLWLQARLFDEPQLASLCLDTIDKSTADAINAEGFTDIDLGTWVFLTQCFFLFSSGCKLTTTLCICACRNFMCSATKRHTQHQGEPLVRCGGTLGRCRVLQTTASPNFWEQTDGSGQSPPAHSLPAHDRGGVRCR